jgi:hypothetical protein
MASRNDHYTSLIARGTARGSLSDGHGSSVGYRAGAGESMGGLGTEEE